MLTEKVVVTRVGDAHIWVEPISSSSCGSCASKTACGQSLYAKFFAHNRQVAVAKKANMQVERGDKILIGLSETAILSGSTLVYLFPIIALVLACSLGNILRLPEFAVFTLAVLSFLTVAWAVSRYTKTALNDGRFEPVFVEKLHDGSSL